MPGSQAVRDGPLEKWCGGGGGGEGGAGGAFP